MDERKQTASREHNGGKVTKKGKRENFLCKRNIWKTKKNEGTGSTLIRIVGESKLFLAPRWSKMKE